MYVEFSPASIYLECADPNDYRTAYQYGSALASEQSPIAAAPERFTIGFKTYLREFDVTVTARNRCYAQPEKLYFGQEIKRHEDAHALDDEILDLSKKELDTVDFDAKNARAAMVSGANAEINEQFPIVLDRYAESALWRAIDEILSYTRTGQDTGKELAEILTMPLKGYGERHGLYDYYHTPPSDYETAILKPIDQNPNATLSPKIAETVVKEMEAAHRRHGATVKRLVDLAERIGTDADITHEELYSWLAIEAHQSEDAAEVEKRWKKLAAAARVSYLTSLARKSAA